MQGEGRRDALERRRGAVSAPPPGTLHDLANGSFFTFYTVRTAMKAMLLAATLMVCAISFLSGCRAEGQVGDTQSNVGAAR